MHGTLSRRLLYRFFVSALSLLLALYPDLVYAQQAASSIIVDNTTDPSAAAPSLDRTANGVEQVDIATPNSAGLSHNLFTQYNVEQKGLILNNATEATQTQLGGYVYANSNLKGSSAKVILNEVTGQQASQMLGYTEVAGQKANVVIANPNGITCNGCGFLNTSRVTLASGHPELDASGALSALTVTDGLVAFGRGGGNFTAVPVLDIFSRRIVLDGQVNAQTVQMAAGRNRIDYSSGAVHPLSSDGSQAPEFAIDSSAFGGMYAGRISMLVNEAGAGVRVDGQMAANAGDMTLTADGQLVLNGSMSATGNVTVTAGSIQNTGALQAGGSTQVVSVGAISNSGQLTAGQGLSVAGTDIRNLGTLNAAGTAGMTVAADGSLVNDGSVGATAGAVSLHGAHIANVAGGTVAAQAGLTLQSDAEITNAGVLGAATGSVSLTAQGSVSQTSGHIAAQGGALQVAASSLTNDVNSSITATGGMQLNVLALSNSGTIFAGSSLALPSAAVLTNTGTLEGDSSVTIQAGTLANGGTLASRQGSLDIVAFDGIQNSGTLYGATTTAIAARGTLNNDGGQIGAGNSSLRMQAETLENDSGKVISTSGSVTIQSKVLSNRSGTIQGQNDVAIITPTLDNRTGGLIQSAGANLYLADGDEQMTSLYNQGGSFGAADTLSLDTRNYENDSRSAVVSAGALILTVAGTLTNAGQLVGQKGFNLTVGDFINEVTGILAAGTGNGNLTTTGTSQLVNAGAIESLQAGSNLKILTASGGLSNNGLIIGSGTTTIVSSGSVNNNGKISALGGALNLQASGLINMDTLVAQGPLISVVSGDLTNSGTLYGATGTDIEATGTLSNNGATAKIAADGALSLKASTLINTSGQIIADTGTLTVSTRSLSNSGGTLQGDTSTRINADILANTADGAILSKSGMLMVGGQSTISAQSISNLAGTLQAATNLSILGNAIDNSNGTFIARNGSVAASAGTGLFLNNGVMQSATGMTLSGDSYVGDIGSIINAGTSLDLNFGTSLDTAGHIVAAQDLFVQTGTLTTHAGAASDTVAVVASTGGNMTVTAATINNAGVLETTDADGAIKVHGTDLTNSGAITAGSSLTVTETGRLVSSGSLIASKGPNVLTAANLTNNGTLYGGTTLVATGMDSFENTRGQIGAGQGALTLASNGAFSNGSGEIIAAGGPLVITAATITGSAGGLLQSFGSVILTAGQISNDNSTILAKGGDITLASGNNGPAALRNVDGGVIQAIRAVSATFVSLDNTGGIVSALGGDLSLNGASGSSVNNSGGTFETANNLTLTAGSYSGTGPSRMTAEQDMTLNLSRTMENGGNIAAVHDVSVTAFSLMNDAHAVLGSTSGNLRLDDIGGVVNAGTIQTSGVGNTLTLTASSIDNQTTGAILSNGAQSLAAEVRTHSLTSGTLSNDGLVSAYNNSLTVTATVLDNSGVIEAGTDTSLSASGDIVNTGLIYAANGITIDSANVRNTGGQIGTGSGSLTANTGTFDNTNSGRIVATSGAMYLTTDKLNDTGGLVDSASTLIILTNFLDNVSGKILSEKGSLLVAAKADDAAFASINNNAGLLQAAGDQTLRTATLTNINGQIITVGGNLTLTGSPGMTSLQSVDGTKGVLQSGQDLTLDTDNLTGVSGLSAARDLSFSTEQSIAGAMLFSAGRNALVRIGGAYSISSGSGVVAGGDTTVFAASITNAGTIMAGGVLSVSTPGAIENTGLIDGTGGVTLALDGALTNLEAAILSENGGISIGGKSGIYAGEVLNRSAEILASSAAGDVVIHAISLTNDIDGGVVQSDVANIVYDHIYTLNQDQLAKPPTLNPTWTVEGHNIYDEMQPYYKEVMRIYVPELFYSADGKKGQGYDLVVMNRSSGNSYVEVQGSETQAVTAGHAASLIDAGKDLTIETVGSVVNDASHIAAGRDMSLAGSSLSNTGYGNSITWTLIANARLAKRWMNSADPNAVLVTEPAAATEAPMPSFMPNGYVKRLWGTSIVPGLSASIVAGGALAGSFTGQINNTTVIEHADSVDLANASQYTGSTPGAIDGEANTRAPETGGSMRLPGSQGHFAAIATEATTTTSGMSAINNAGIGTTKVVTTPQNARPNASGVENLPSYGGLLAPAGYESGANAGQALVLPGFGSAGTPTVNQLILSIPGGKALYVPNPSPTAGYLIETNPRYASQKAFDGSEYLLDRLGAQPQDYVFLGDDSFDQSYVRQQIITATGQSYLGTTYTTAAAQMQALVDNAATQSASLGLTLGQALTPTQQSQLTSDMVWYVSEDVGGKSVLVPKLYLASGHEALTGATITAKNVSLTASSVTNSGTITGSNSLNLTATSGNITNTGALSGGNVSLAAQNGSIINNDTLNDYLVTGGTQGQLASVGKITATGSAALTAAKDITFNGGTLGAGSDLSVIAGNSLSLGNTTLKQAASISSWKLSMNASAVQNYGTSISAGGNATLAALGGDLTAGGATLTTGGDLTLSAAKTLDLGSVTNSSTMDVSGHKSGFLTHSSFTNNQSSTTEVGSTVAAGGTLTAVSGGDMTVKGILGATGDATLLSGGSFTESATKSTSDVSASHHVSGFSLSTQGASGTVGYGSRTDSYSESITQYTPSVIASLSGSLNIASAGKATVDASVISAAKDALLSGSSVAFTTEQNTATQTVSHKDKSIGLTGGVSPNSIVGQIIDTALSASQTSGKGSTTLSTLDAMQGAYLAGTGIAAGLQSGAGKLFSLGKEGSASGNMDLIGVQAGVGFSSHSQSTTQSETDVQGSAATAGGTLSVVARGDSASDAANGALSAVAAQLNGQNIALAARNGISLSAGRDTTSTDSRYSSKSAFLGVEGNVGTNGLGLSVAASFGAQKQNAASASSTAVDTTVRASNAVSVTTPGAMALNGAEISGRRVDVSAGSLSITSPQNTSDYHSSATQAGANLSVSFLGAGETGGGASYTHQTITDHYASTGGTLSGLYAGAQGLGVDVGGNTSLTAGVLSSTATAALNHFGTGSLTAQGVENVSTWHATQTGASFSAGTGMMGSTTGILGAVGMGLASGASGLTGGGRSHNESSESLSAIGNNIGVTAGSTTGSYTRDVSAADRALQNAFDAQSLDNQLQAQQMGSQVVGEVGGKVSDALQNAGVPGFDGRNIFNAGGRIGLETAGNAVIAAVTGGNAGSAALSTAAGDGASIASRDWAYSVAKTFTSDKADQKLIANALSNVIASGAGAIGGTISGQAGSRGINALNGAASTSAIQQFNQANENEKTVAQSDLPTGYTGTSQPDSPDIIQTVYSEHYAKQYDLVGDTSSPVRDSNGNTIFREKNNGDYFVFVNGTRQIPEIPQTKSGSHNGSQQNQSIIAQVDPQTGKDIYTQVEKQTALNNLQNSSLSYLLNQDGSFIGTPGTGSAQIMPASPDPNATAEAFAKQAFGSNSPREIEALNVKGRPGWVAKFADGTAISYRSAGAASFRTPDGMATVEIKTENIKTLNYKKPLKLKFPGE
jgi:filamentous hemagglutinin